MLNDAIADLRHSLGELKSPQENDPFPLALRNLAEDTRFRSLVDISLVIDLPDGEDMAPVRAEHVLSVVNEALANIVRHAQASQVLITVSKQEDQFRLTIKDDGIGITESVQAGYGLRNMRDRARMLGGEIEFTPAKGKGTCVSLEIPWKDKR